jgi:hypothetical protein
MVVYPEDYRKGPGLSRQVVGRGQDKSAGESGLVGQEDWGLLEKVGTREGQLEPCWADLSRHRERPEDAAQRPSQVSTLQHPVSVLEVAHWSPCWLCSVSGFCVAQEMLWADGPPYAGRKSCVPDAGVVFRASRALEC